MSEVTNLMSREAPTTEFDVRDFRRALGTFLTGVTVVTTLTSSGTPIGFTANSFTSVSLEPPLVLVCIARTASSFAVFEETDRFAISVLSEVQKDVSSTFASRNVDRFTSVSWHPGETGMPIMSEAAAWFDCETHDRIVAGDHLILIGRVRSYSHTASRPLGYCRGAYVSFQLEDDLLTVSHERSRIGAIIECNGALLLSKDNASGRFGLISASRLGAAEDPQSLYGKLARLGNDVALDFLFSVYDDEKTKTLNVYYRGIVKSTVEVPGTVVFPFDQIPWEQLETEEIRIMLRRYVTERIESRFSIYAGNASIGDYREVNAVPVNAVMPGNPGKRSIPSNQNNE